MNRCPHHATVSIPSPRRRTQLGGYQLDEEDEFWNDLSWRLTRRRVKPERNPIPPVLTRVGRR